MEWRAFSIRPGGKSDAAKMIAVEIFVRGKAAVMACLIDGSLRPV